MKKIFMGAISGAILLAPFPLPAQEDGNLMQQIMKCREYVDAEQRVACYDGLSQPEPAAEKPEVAAVTETETVATEVESKVEPDPQEAPVSDDFGLPKSDDERPTIEAMVVRCGKASNRKFYFYLDNGQIWQYLGINELRYRSCNSPATLSEDRMGFTLRLDGKSSVRVRRVK